jgi:predicted dithiol-disulfide oxidoreductase (DUF899 family)
VAQKIGLDLIDSAGSEIRPYQSGFVPPVPWADNFNGVGVHLHHRDVTLVAISRAPWEKLEGLKRRMGWNFKWLSSGNNDFNYDYQVSFTPEALKVQVEYNYAKRETEMSDLPGVSVFCKDGDGNIYHTYSAYARGIAG